MIKLEIKYISSPNVNLESWRPKELKDVCIPITVDIGEEGDDASEIFQAVIATPEGLRDYLDKEGEFYRFSQYYIIVTEYNWKVIKDVIRARVNLCCRESWQKSALLLSRYFLWEYEDCQWVSEES